jgi:hypothetical protein
MSTKKAYNPGNGEGGRIIGETGEVLQVDGDWQLEEHDGDEGCVIVHSCGRYMVDLNRRYNMCRNCGAEIPPSMISGFTLLNWNKVDDDEYFVHPLNEITDFCYNGHLRDQLKGYTDWGTLDKDADIDAVTEVLDEWKAKQGLT